MNLLCAALCAALCLASVYGYDIGPLNATIIYGTLEDKVELTPDDIQASKNLIGLLELIRRFMAVGIDETVPPFDPYVKRQLHPAVFNHPDSDLHGIVQLSNLVATGGQKFILNKIEVQNKSMRIDFDISVPQVIAEIDYLAANFKYHDFVFNTSGHIQLILENLRMEGAVGFVVLNHVDTLQPFFTTRGVHMFSSTDNVQINHDIGYIPREVLDEVKDVLLLAVTGTAMETLSDILFKHTIEQVIYFLYGRF